MNLIRKTAAVLRREGKYFVFVGLALGLQREKWWNSKPETFQTYLNLFGVEKHDSWILPSRALTHIPPGGKRKIIHSKVPWYSRGDMLVSKRVIFILAPFSGRATASGTHGVPRWTRACDSVPRCWHHSLEFNQKNRNKKHPTTKWIHK